MPRDIKSLLHYGEFSVGETVKIVRSGSGLAGHVVGRSAVIADLSADGYDGSPGVKLVGYYNYGFDDWIGLISIAAMPPDLEAMINALDDKIEAMERRIS